MSFPHHTILDHHHHSFRNSRQAWQGIPIMAANMDGVGTFEMANVLAERQVKLGEATLLPEEKSKEVNKLANKIGEAILRFFS